MFVSSIGTYVLIDADEYVQKNVATLIREVVKHSPELAQLVVNAGGPYKSYMLYWVVF